MIWNVDGKKVSVYPMWTALFHKISKLQRSLMVEAAYSSQYDTKCAPFEAVPCYNATMYTGNEGYFSIVNTHPFSHHFTSVKLPAPRVSLPSVKVVSKTHAPDWLRPWGQRHLLPKFPRKVTKSLDSMIWSPFNGSDCSCDAPTELLGESIFIRETSKGKTYGMLAVHQWFRRPEKKHKASKHTAEPMIL